VIEPIQHRVLLRYPQILEKAFERYPAEIIGLYLEAIYFASKMKIDDFYYGGTYDQYRRIIYIVDNGRVDDMRALYVFHHEFSSILLFANPFPISHWFRHNPDDFIYLNLRQDFDFEAFGKASSDGNEADYENGFMNDYGRTSFENDFNEYSAMIFTYPEKFKGIMDRYPRVRGKFLVWLKVFQKADPSFTEEYLLGQFSSETGAAGRKTGRFSNQALGNTSGVT
jgi:hypothetical protein